MVALSAETSTFDGSVLVTVTSTPPCPAALRFAPVPTSSPAPTVIAADGVIDAPATSTWRTPVADMVRRFPGPDTVTDVEPLARASKPSPHAVPADIARVK